MKRIITVVILMAMVLSIAGCTGDPVDVTVRIKNSTEYELAEVILQIPPKRGAYSPMHDLVTSGDETLKPNEEREIVVSIIEADLGGEGWAIIFVKDDETKYEAKGMISLENGENSFDITCDDKMLFTITAISN